MTITIVVAGTRWADASLTDTIEGYLDETLDYLLAKYDLPDDEPVRIVEGDGPGEPGVDKLIESIALARGYEVTRRPAQWAECGDGCPTFAHRKPSRRGDTYCPKAGPRRSRAMIDEFRGEAKGLLGLPEIGCNGGSGTWKAIHYAADVGLEPIIRPLAVVRPTGWGGDPR